MISRFALAATLSLALGACGSGGEPTDTASQTAAGPSDAGSMAPAAAPTDASSEAAPSDTASTAAATPTPTASASAKPTPAPSPSVAASGAAAGPPQAFNQCTACHSTAPGKTIIGPTLAHVYGRKAGTLPGFQYSDAMKNSGLTWNQANLDAFLANPAGKVPGTLMGLAGISDAAQRKAIIDYLKTL
jgi:cytochrome c2